MAARPGMWDQLSNRITASQQMPRSGCIGGCARSSSRIAGGRGSSIRSRRGGGGGVVSAAGAGASVLLPQALSTNAATKALKASLVFIYRYPRNIKNKILRPSVLLGLHPNVRSILECFGPISYLFRDAFSAFNALDFASGVKGL
jgi:hypothetical protein